MNKEYFWLIVFAIFLMLIFRQQMQALQQQVKQVQLQTKQNTLAAQLALQQSSQGNQIKEVIEERKPVGFKLPEKDNS